MKYLVFRANTAVLRNVVSSSNGNQQTSKIGGGGGRERGGGGRSGRLTRGHRRLRYGTGYICASNRANFI